MNKYLAIACILLLGACSGTPSKKEHIPEGGTLLLVSSHPNYLCHRHWGMTVFGNFTKTYDLKSDLNLKYETNLASALEEKGYRTVSISREEFLGEQKNFYDVNPWTAEQSISADFLPHFNSLKVKYNFDAIIVGTHWGPDRDEIANKNSCYNFIYRTFSQPGKNEGNVILPDYQLFYSSGVSGGRYYNPVSAQLPPNEMSNIKNLNSIDIGLLESLLEEEMKKVALKLALDISGVE